MKLLHVEDSREDAELFHGLIRGEWPDTEFEQVGSRPEFLDAVERGGFDLILSDFTMPTFDGMSALELSGALCPGIPFVFLSGTLGEERAIAALKRGAADYVLKDRPERLIPALREVLERKENERRLRGSDEHARAHVLLLQKARNDFLAVISHELRTPLSALLGSVELMFALLPSSLEADEYRQLFDQARRRLMTFVDDALLLAQIQSGGPRPSPQPVLLDEVLAAAIGDMRELAEARSVAIRAEGKTCLLVEGHGGLLVKSFGALLETAVKLAAPAGTVVLDCGGTPAATTTVTITTAGRTVPTDLLPRFFETLAIARVIIAGDDLGLRPAVAEQILAICGGSVSIENLDPPGVRFNIRLRASDE